tara:strand:- start:1110 stop:1475 length:366 start_codon:yes stop_codon:yes gene_type:complete
MKPYKASLINSLLLIIMGFWGLLNINPEIFSGVIINISPFIPISLGVLILLCNNGIKNNNKVIAHVAVLLTLISLANLIPFTKAINEGRNDAAIRIGIMILSSLFAMVIFIKSFIANRAKK